MNAGKRDFLQARDLYPYFAFLDFPAVSWPNHAKKLSQDLCERQRRKAVGLVCFSPDLHPAPLSAGSTCAKLLRRGT